MKKLFLRIKQFQQHPLTSKNIFAALFRYLKFNLLHYIYPKPRTYPFVDGVNFIAEKGMAGIVGNIYFGIHEFEEMAFVMHYLRNGDKFLDIGANVGAYSLLASGVKGANSYAIEPVPQTFDQLNQNIKLNNLQNNLLSFQIGFGETSGVLEFSQHRGTMNRVVKGGKNIVKVEVSTLDQFVKQLNFVPEIIKIDVEGFEIPVLLGGVETISDNGCNAIIIEINGSGKLFGFNDEQIHELLTQKGFHPISYNPLSRTFNKMSSYNKNKFNTIYIKNAERAQSRLRSSPKFRVLNQSI